MWGISILADIRPMGCKLSCCGNLWSGQGLFVEIYSRTLCNGIGDKYIGKKNSNKYLSVEMHMHFNTAKFEYIHCTVCTKHATGYVLLNPM